MVRGVFICFLAWMLTIVSLSVLDNQACVAQGTKDPKQHPWARFPIGSWNRMRQITENFDEKGNLSSISKLEITSTLSEVGDTDYTLLVEESIEVGGRRTSDPPKTEKLSLDPRNGSAHISNLSESAGQLTINLETIDCVIHRFDVEQEVHKMSVTEFVSSSIYPYLLKSSTTLTTDENGAGSVTIDREVVALQMPERIKNEIKPCAYVRLESSGPDGKRFVFETLCQDVPGGVVRKSIREHDSSGRLVRRVTVELLDYKYGELVDDSNPAGPEGELTRRTGRRPLIHRARALRRRDR